MSSRALWGDGGSPATEDSRLQRALSGGRRLCSDREMRMEKGVQLGRGGGRGEEAAGERRRQRCREAEAEEPTWAEAEVPAQLFRVLQPYELGTESLVWLVSRPTGNRVGRNQI